jgi:autotransporter-associated beta strand protein
MQSSRVFRRRLSASSILLAAIAVQAFPAAARASLFNWVNATSTWNQPTSWAENAVPVSGAATALQFGGSGTVGYTASNDLGTFDVGQITLNSTNTATGSLAPGVDGALIRFVGPNAGVVQNNLGDFYFRGPVDVRSVLNVSGDGTGSVTFDGAVSGMAGIVKTGTSPFRFGTAVSGMPSTHTFVGGVTVNAGAFRFNSSSDSGRTALRSNQVYLATGTTLSANSQIRIGELSGAGTVVTTDTSTGGIGDGHDFTISGLGNATFAGTLNLLPTATGTVAGKINTRGLGTQTFSGTLLTNDDISIGRMSGIVLSGTASVASNVKGIVQMHGGTLTLDNTAVNNNNRLRDSGTASTGLEDVGGGLFQLIGNAAGTTETIGRIDLGSATAARGGALSVRVVQPAGATGATVLSIAGYQRDSTKSPRGTLDFSATNAAGTPLTLGLTGVSPRITFTSGFTLLLRNGLLSRSNLSANDNVGWATVNGSDFATVGTTANGIAPVATVAMPTASTATANALLTASTTLATNAAFSLNSLKIAPTAAGQALTLSGSTALSTNASLLAGTNDFTITGGTGGITGPGGARYVHVQSAQLSVDVPISTGAPLVKSGGGLLALSSSSNTSSQQPWTINAGTLRAGNGTSLTSGCIELRGGVLELTSPTFNRPLGSTIGQVNWRNDSTEGGFFPGISDTDKGSGGFSAFGTTVNVTLTVQSSTQLVWEDPYFVDGAHNLIFGSTRSNARLIFNNDVNLTGTGVVNYNLRNVQVIDNPGSAADLTELHGNLVGAVTDDLLKSGNGTLELSGTNTLPGGVIVGDGTLLFASNAAIGDGAPIILGQRTGSANVALYASHAAGASVLTRDVLVVSGNSGAATIGNLASPGASTVGNLTSTGRVSVGTTGATDARVLNLAASAATTVSFAGSIGKTPGFGGTLAIHTTNTGTVRLANGLQDCDSLFVDAGTLAIDPNGTASGTTRVRSLTISGGATPTSRLDIANNKLVIDYDAASPLSDVVNWIKAGYAAGTWNGQGIASSTISSGYGVGYSVTPSGVTSFGGVAVDATSILIGQTLRGDSNLDGRVDFNDLLALAAAYNQSSQFWSNGDFNYDGTVDFNDLLALASNYNQTVAAAPGGFSFARAIVPEPTALLAPLGITAALGRRRRQ